MDKDTSPASQALKLIARAEQEFKENRALSATSSLQQALDFQSAVEGMTSSDAFDAHFQFIEVMTRGSILALNLGNDKLAKDLYDRVQSWAYDPVCSDFALGRKMEKLWQDWHRRAKKPFLVFW